MLMRSCLTTCFLIIIACTASPDPFDDPVDSEELWTREVEVAEPDSAIDPVKTRRVEEAFECVLHEPPKGGHVETRYMCDRIWMDLPQQFLKKHEHLAGATISVIESRVIGKKVIVDKVQLVKKPLGRPKEQAGRRKPKPQSADPEPTAADNQRRGDTRICKDITCDGTKYKGKYGGECHPWYRPVWDFTKGDYFEWTANQDGRRRVLFYGRRRARRRVIRRHELTQRTDDTRRYTAYSDDRCKRHGDDIGDCGLTPNEACCHCGGGCRDKLCGYFPWHDSDGPYYDCAWYEKPFGSNYNLKCQLYGDSSENCGMTANEACCACHESKLI